MKIGYLVRHFYQTHWNGYNDHVDNDELNYIDSYISDTAIEKFRELTRVFGDEVHGDIGGDDINEWLEERYNDEWDAVGDNMLYTMSEGLDEHKRNEMKEYFKDESILEYNVSHDDVDFFISWDTLLFLCYLNGIKSFDGLADYDIFEIEGVYETYQDSWGIGNEYRDEIDKEFIDSYG